MDIPKSTIKIIGTSHIAKHSAKEIEETFFEFQPDIIAVELDMRRLQSLRNPNNQSLPLSLVQQIGLTGYIFASIGKAMQKKLGNIVKVEPGVDMLTAVKLAEQHHKQLKLVDQDVLVTMRHLSKKFTWKEKLRVVRDIFSSGKKYNIRLDRVPDKKVIEQLIGMMKERYPSLYHVLIVERNIVMARNLDMIVRRNPGKKILLVIGAGHDEDLRNRLKVMERIADII